MMAAARASGVGSSWRQSAAMRTLSPTATSASLVDAAVAPAATSADAAASPTASAALLSLGPDGLHCLAERMPAASAVALCLTSASTHSLLRASAPHAVSDCMLSEVASAARIEASGLWRVDGVQFMLPCAALEVDALAKLRSLRHVTFLYCLRLDDLAPLARVPHLRSLKLVSCPRVIDLDALADCRCLLRLTLSTVTRPLDLAPLARCPRLEALDLLFCSRMNTPEALAPLAACQSLRRLRLTPSDACCEIIWPRLAGQCGLQRVHVLWHHVTGPARESAPTAPTAPAAPRARCGTAPPPYTARCPRGIRRMDE